MYSYKGTNKNYIPDKILNLHLKNIYIYGLYNEIKQICTTQKILSFSNILVHKFSL